MEASHTQAPLEESRLFELLSKLIEETIDDVEMAELNTALETDAKAREIYTGYMAMHVNIKRQIVSIGTNAMNDAGEDEKRTRLFQRYLLYQRMTAVAALIAILSMTWAITSIFSNRSPETDVLTKPDDVLLVQQPERTYQSVAVVTEAAYVRLKNSDKTAMDRTLIGRPLGRGDYELESGILKVEFYGGTSMLVEAPARFRLLGMNRAHCQSGRFRFMAGPITSPFQIGHMHGLIKNASGACAITIQDDGVKIKCYSGSQSVIDAKKTESIKITTENTFELSSGEVIRTAIAEESFLQDNALRKTQLDGVKHKQHLWQIHLDKLAGDDSVIRHYTFQGRNGNRILKNHGTKSSDLDGTVIGSQWRKGRWQGKRALSFNKEGDRVRIHVPGEFKNLSMSCWLYIDQLDNLFNAILMSDGYESRELHWQFRSRNGDLVLGIQAEDEQDRGMNYEAKAVLDEQHLKEWLLLTVVYHGEKGTVSHFINGQRVSEETILQPGPLRIGDAAIGNWLASHYEKLSTNPFRRFHGRIDEMILFSRPLSESEIKDFYEDGKPYMTKKSDAHSEF